MVVVGMDSAKRTGLAVLSRAAGDRERLLHSSVVTVRTAADVEAVVAQLADQRPDVVAIEEPFYSLREPSAGIPLARLLGRWLQSWETKGFTCMTVPASIWQPGILRGLIRPRALRAERKAAAQLWVRATFGAEAAAVGEDACDACCMAAWVLRNATLKARAASSAPLSAPLDATTTALESPDRPTPATPAMKETSHDRPRRRRRASL